MPNYYNFVLGCVFLLVASGFSKKIKRDKSNENLTITINSGSLRGAYGRTIDRQRQYVSYRGIPYAEAPVGNLRFMPPVPVKNWTGIRSAVEDGSPCVQNLPVTGSEDCLFINVYKPLISNTNSSSVLPVLVWIYGGAFISGGSSYDRFGPDFFLNEGLMFVSFNYRLGVFGFLSTEDMESPGNYGLKDQLLALRWVQDNIGHFGGDPGQVTIFGESAGGASVSYLVQSPLSKGLFQRAISNSGGTLTQWALTRKPRKIAQRIAQMLLIDTRDSRSIVDGLRKVNYRRLHVTSSNAELLRLLGNFLHGLVYSPTIEPKHPGAVLSGKSHQLLEQSRAYNRVPYLMGFNSKESGGWLETNVFFGAPAYLVGAPLLASYDLDSRKLVPASMNVEERLLSEVGNKIRGQYFEWYETITLNHRQFEDFLSDDQFVRPIRETVRLYSRDVPVYYYRFSYMGNLGLTESQQERYSTEGVSHAEDLNYLFRINESRVEGKLQDFQTRYRLVRLWSNFAKYGNPTPEKDDLLQGVVWPMAREPSTNASSNTLKYLDIGNDLTVRENPEESSWTFWTQIFDQYGRPPYDTY